MPSTFSPLSTPSGRSPGPPRTRVRTSAIASSGSVTASTSSSSPSPSMPRLRDHRRIRRPGVDLADRLGPPPLRPVRQRRGPGDRHRRAARRTARERRRPRGGNHRGCPSPDARRQCPGGPGASRPRRGRFDEAPLLELALEHSVGAFSFDCTHARHAADAAAVLAEHVDAVERRRLDLIPCQNGLMAVRGYFDPVGGAELQTVLGRSGPPEGPDEPASCPGGLPTRSSSSPPMPSTSG